MPRFLAVVVSLRVMFVEFQDSLVRALGQDSLVRALARNRDLSCPFMTLSRSGSGGRVRRDGQTILLRKMQMNTKAVSLLAEVCVPKNSESLVEVVQCGEGYDVPF